jgi:uncharacterized membrane protein YjjP (DUF1212 family)
MTPARVVMFLAAAAISAAVTKLIGGDWADAIVVAVVLGLIATVVRVPAVARQSRDA